MFASAFDVEYQSYTFEIARAAFRSVQRVYGRRTPKRRH